MNLAPKSDEFRPARHPLSEFRCLFASPGYVLCRLSLPSLTSDTFQHFSYDTIATLSHEWKCALTVSADARQ